mmetsp:Transcript_63714/g.129386  ORF Transcript_63714/g.129386 Transcript_63714/m.129386 type:complete len:206 (-) Transcript_63714:318-935(-)
MPDAGASFASRGRGNVGRHTVSSAGSGTPCASCALDTLNWDASCTQHDSEGVPSPALASSAVESAPALNTTAAGAPMRNTSRTRGPENFTHAHVGCGMPVVSTWMTWWATSKPKPAAAPRPKLLSPNGMSMAPVSIGARVPAPSMSTPPMTSSGRNPHRESIESRPDIGPSSGMLSRLENEMTDTSLELLADRRCCFTATAGRRA